MPGITIYGADWCGDCRRTKRFLNEHEITYTWIDIDRDQTGEQYVLSVNKGMRSIPTIIFGDGTTLVEPSTRELALKLGV
ncbi:MAG: NrdH-redoxin [Chloroflexota bacterium]|nr:MAG: NrdH-redoxin [Chloroflexota bacterium]